MPPFFLNNVNRTQIPRNPITAISTEYLNTYLLKGNVKLS